MDSLTGHPDGYPRADGHLRASEVLGVDERTARRDKASANVEPESDEQVEPEPADSTNVEPKPHVAANAGDKEKRHPEQGCRSR